jgi:anti-anti-sigma regulatory factor
MIEKTINETAIYLMIFDGKEKGQLTCHLDFSNLERNAIILDFSKTNSINSAFISDIIEIYEKCITDNVKFIISGISQVVKNVFDCIGISKALEHVIQK